MNSTYLNEERLKDILMFVLSKNECIRETQLSLDIYEGLSQEREIILALLDLNVNEIMG